MKRRKGKRSSFIDKGERMKKFLVCLFICLSIAGNVFAQQSVAQQFAGVGVAANTANLLGQKLGDSSLAFTGDPYQILANTEDGADTKGVCIGGGGTTAQSRGASFCAYGNEETSTAGDINIKPGSTGTTTIYGPAGVAVFEVNSSGINVATGTSVMQAAVGALTAAGTTITDALQLSRVYNQVGTVASGTGVKLWDQSGTPIIVQNLGANDLELYPPDADDVLNAASAGASLTLAAATDQIASCTKVTTTNWVCLIGAGPAT